MTFKSTSERIFKEKKRIPRSTNNDLSNHIVFSVTNAGHARKNGINRKYCTIYIGAFQSNAIGAYEGDKIDFLYDDDAHEGIIRRVGQNDFGVVLTKPSRKTKSGRLIARFPIYPGCPNLRELYRINGEDIDCKSDELIFDLPGEIFYLEPEQDDQEPEQDNQEPV